MDDRSRLPGPDPTPPTRVRLHSPAAAVAATALTAALTATAVVVRSPAATTTVAVTALGPDHDLLLLVPETDPVAQAVRGADIGELVVLAEASAVTPAALPDRVLARVWLRGTLAEVVGPGRRVAARALAQRAGLGLAARQVADVAPGEAVLRLAVAGGDLVDGPVQSPVDLREWRAARLDPVADCSAGLVAHLLADHAGELAALARVVAPVLPAAATGPAGRPRLPVLVAVDRAGTRWRCASRGGAVDARLDFPEPLDGLAGLPGALRALAAAAAAPGSGRPCRLRDCGTAGPRP